MFLPSITHEDNWKEQGPLKAEDLQAAILTYQDMWKAVSFFEVSGNNSWYMSEEVPMDHTLRSQKGAD